MFGKPLTAALLGAAALLVSAPAAHAASCCGGGGGTSLILPKFNHEMVGLSFEAERYDGLWRRDGSWVPDPPGSDLNQYRLNAGYARRLGTNWQGSISIPYVWNRNEYSGLRRNTDGFGDASISLWYETFDNITCVYEVNSWEDLKPAVYLGGMLIVPTGVSPYDSVDDNFDITGRGFYRLDATMLVEKTVFPWNAGLELTYGTYLERSVNQEYGRYVEPYKKELGDRSSWSVNFGRTFTLESFNTLTATLAYTDLSEDEATVNGKTDPTTGFRKRSVAATLAWATGKKDWVVKGTYTYTPREDDWGENFPTTDLFSISVNHVLR